MLDMARRPAFFSGLITFLALAASAFLVGQHWLAVTPDMEGYNPDALILYHATLPRLVMALVCGMALGIAGAILQQVLRNPLASPTTLGIDAGARLALALATLLAPELLGLGRDLVALLGSLVTALIVFAIGRRNGFSPLTLVLTGLVISLYCGALSALLVLVGDRFMASLFIWGSGSLSVQSWQPVTDLLLRISISVVPLIWLLRPLAILDTDESIASGLGINIVRTRVIALTCAVALTAFVTSAVGIIGFIGLVAPIIARLSGADRFLPRLIHSGIIGGFLLLLTDAALQLLQTDGSFIPTGAVTAVLASPLLLILLPRLKTMHRSLGIARPPSNWLTRRPPALPMLVLGLVLVVAAVMTGRNPGGEWEWTPFASDISSLGVLWHDVLAWRLPRLLAAALAGALLGVAGLLLQRLTGNELASPEVLGVSAGSIIAVAISLYAIGVHTAAVQNTAAVVGGFVVLGLLLVLGRTSGFAPERILIAGIALNALIDAVVGVLTASGDPRAIMLLGWMSGTIGGTQWQDMVPLSVAALLLIPCALLAGRWLRMLPMGAETAGALGVPVAAARFSLLMLAAGLTAFATFAIGPLTFVGLMAPHVVLLLGVRNIYSAILATAAAGAVIMAVADTLARTVAHPLQLPTGLTAAILCAPVLLWLLSRRQAASG